MEALAAARAANEELQSCCVFQQSLLEERSGALAGEEQRRGGLELEVVATSRAVQGLREEMEAQHILATRSLNSELMEASRAEAMEAQARRQCLAEEGLMAELDMCQRAATAEEVRLATELQRAHGEAVDATEEARAAAEAATCAWRASEEWSSRLCFAEGVLREARLVEGELEARATAAALMQAQEASTEATAGSKVRATMWQELLNASRMHEASLEWRHMEQEGEEEEGSWESGDRQRARADSISSSVTSACQMRAEADGNPASPTQHSWLCPHEGGRLASPRRASPRSPSPTNAADREASYARRLYGQIANLATRPS